MKSESKSENVTISTRVTEDGYNVKIVAEGVFVRDGKEIHATAVREFSSYVSVANSVSKEDAIGAFKRDALRELVTQLNLHEVL